MLCLEKAVCTHTLGLPSHGVAMSCMINHILLDPCGNVELLKNTFLHLKKKLFGLLIFLKTFKAFRQAKNLM